MRIELPYPSPKLSPNARLHHMQRHRVAQAARTAAAWAAKSQGAKRLTCDRVAVKVTLCAPDNRRRDTDNAIASTKAASDGIRDVIGVDDSRWQVTYAWGPVVKGGALIYEIEVAE